MVFFANIYRDYRVFAAVHDFLIALSTPLSLYTVHVEVPIRNFIIHDNGKFIRKLREFFFKVRHDSEQKTEALCFVAFDWPRMTDLVD